MNWPTHKIVSPLDRRRAGVLLHPSSLPGPGQTGELGEDAYRFVRFLSSAGLSVWQTLPMGPPHADGSPYQCFSINAGDTRLISLQLLQDWGWLAQPHPERAASLVAAHQGFIGAAEPAQKKAFADFLHQQAHWLDDFALFSALKARHGDEPWWTWEQGLRDRQDKALAGARSTLQVAIAQCCFEQFVFFRQWLDVKRYANEQGILLFGDMPIFVGHDSAEVWAYRHLFDLDEHGQVRRVAGVPPDYFSATGQRWGNPLYNWKAMEAEDFAWWRHRVETQCVLFDLIRVDHFRGFEAYWAIDADHDTAMHGQWVKAPGEKLFKALLQHHETLPLVAEDLGVITEQVEQLRDNFGLPGMKILQFAFDGEAKNPYLPYKHLENCVVYTGTHDNDTSLGWFQSCDPAVRARVLEYLGQPTEAMPWCLLRQAFASVARLAVAPMQDFLSLGSEHRMNRPGTCEGNWRWRFQWDQLEPDLAARIKRMSVVYGRL